MFAFGICTQSLMYPNQQVTSSLLGNVFLPSYFLVGSDNLLRNPIMAGSNNNINGIWIHD
jgi:hypothetical protein